MKMMFTIAVLLMSIAQIPAQTMQGALPPLPFVLTKAEGLEVENFRLRKKLIEEMANDLTKDINQYVAVTLADHKQPKNVTFDYNTLTWRLNSPDQQPSLQTNQPEKPSADKTPAKQPAPK